MKQHGQNITAESYPRVIETLRGMTNWRGKVFSGFKSETEMVLQAVCGIINGMHTLDYDLLKGVADGKDAKELLWESALARHSKAYSSLAEDSGSSMARVVKVATKDECRKVFDEFYEEHFYPLLESVAKKPKKFIQRGETEAEASFSAQQGSTYVNDPCRTYKERAWVALAVLRREPSVIVRYDKKEATVTLKEFDLKKIQKTDNALLVSRMEKVARVIKNDKDWVFANYGELMYSGRAARLLRETTNPWVRPRRGSKPLFTNKVEVRRSFSPSAMADSSTLETLLEDEKEIESLVRYIKVVKHRMEEIKALIPKGGVQEMLETVMQIIASNAMNFINKEDDKDVKKELAALFLEGLTVTKALNILDKEIKKRS